MGLIIKNGVIYNGAESEPVVYSLDEREIGVYTDGKPLYQKTITANGLSGVSDWAPLDASVSYDTLVSVDGQRFDNNQKFSFTNGMETAPRFQTKNDGKLYYFTNYTISGDVYITIRYTKTTDTPGSGSWTPGGIPAVHYSTEEQVVGTWADGSTIYEKTIDLGVDSLVDYNGKDITNLIPSGINLTISCVGQCSTYHSSTSLLIDYTQSTQKWNIYSGVATYIRYITLRYTKTTS